MIIIKKKKNAHVNCFETQVRDFGLDGRPWEFFCSFTNVASDLNIVISVHDFPIEDATPAGIYVTFLHVQLFLSKISY